MQITGITGDSNSNIWVTSNKKSLCRINIRDNSVMFVDEKVFIFAKEEWQAVLEQFDDVVLDQAIISCLDTHELPPTLPQLLKICRNFNRRHEDMQPKVEDEMKCTPKDVARAHLQNILNKLPKK